MPALRNQRPGPKLLPGRGGWREWILTLCRVPAVGRVSSLLLLTPYAAYHVPDSAVAEPPSPCCLCGGNASLQRRKEATRSSDSPPAAGSEEAETWPRGGGMTAGFLRNGVPNCGRRQRIKGKRRGFVSSGGTIGHR